MTPPGTGFRPRARIRTRRFPADGLAAPEIVLLMALALLAVSAVIPTLMVWRDRHRLAMARSDVKVLVEAGRRFYAEYGMWPTAYAPDRGDVRYGTGIANREVVNALLGQSGPGNENNRVNRSRMNFVRIPPYEDGLSGLDANGDFLDPWGVPYQVILDVNLDNACTVEDTIYQSLVGDGMVVWSCGPDRTSDTPDDIRSWQTLPAPQVVESPM